MEERNLKLVADNNPRKRHLLLLLVALVVIIGLGIYFLLTDFSIQKVEIKGNDTYTNTDILDAMKEDGYVNNNLLMIAQNQIFGQTLSLIHICRRRGYGGSCPFSLCKRKKEECAFNA